MSDDKTIIADSVGLTVFNSPKAKRACLVQYSGVPLGKRYVLEQEKIIAGRSPDNSIVLNDQSVSRQHATFYLSGDKVEIEDLGTTNGTYVNDRKIGGRTLLQDGDILRLGNVLLKFYAHSNIDNVFHDKIYRAATIDAGTQIFNKKYLLESLDVEFRAAAAYGRPLSLIYYDLDFFKKMNDTHGHNAGDYILKECAAVISKVLRKDDIFGRFGGEEFCVVLPGTEAKTAYDLAERIRRTIENHVFQFEGKDLKQTLSIGVSQLNASMKEPKDLLDDADQKLFRSKSEGRNRVTL